MGSSDDGDRLPPPCSSDELSSFLRQILSRSPTNQPLSAPDTATRPQQQPPKRIVSAAEMFDRSFPSVHGGAVSSAGDAVAEIGEDNENKVKLTILVAEKNFTRFESLRLRRKKKPKVVFFYFLFWF